MRRRDFLGFVGGIAGWPFVAYAQARTARIGILNF